MSSNNSIKGREVKREHNGDHSTSGRITHYLEFKEPATREDVEAWLKLNKWLGFHPAGYGATEVKIGADSRHWIYKHSACCD